MNFDFLILNVHYVIVNPSQEIIAVGITNIIGCFLGAITATGSFIYDTIPVLIFKHALLADKEYMLPIKILDAGDNKIDSARDLNYAV